MEHIDCRCAAKELFKNSTAKQRPYYKDEDGFLICSSCHKFLNYMKQLAECDTCDKLFKGYKPYPSISYTCPDCEG